MGSSNEERPQTYGLLFLAGSSNVTDSAGELCSGSLQEAPVHFAFAVCGRQSTAEEAEARDIDNPAIKRNGIGPDTEVPVALHRMTEGMATAGLSITHPMSPNWPVPLMK